MVIRTDVKYQFIGRSLTYVYRYAICDVHLPTGINLCDVKLTNQ